MLGAGGGGHGPDFYLVADGSCSGTLLDESSSFAQFPLVTDVLVLAGLLAPSQRFRSKRCHNPDSLNWVDLQDPLLPQPQGLEFRAAVTVQRSPSNRITCSCLAAEGPVDSCFLQIGLLAG